MKGYDSERFHETCRRMNFIYRYLEKKYGEFWHTGKAKEMEERYKEAIREYEKSKE